MKWRVGYFLIAWLCASTLAIAEALDQPSATPQDVFDSMRAHFHANKAAGMHARYQFEISGPHGGVWAIEVKDGHCQFGKAKITNADVVVTVSDNDWVAISNDKLSGPWAYLTGRLKMRGDRTLARKLDELFP